MKATSQERYNRTQERNEKRRRSESAFALLELFKPSTIEEQATLTLMNQTAKFVRLISQLSILQKPWKMLRDWRRKMPL